jgi:GT2 family glycosyltransferase
MEGLMAPRVVIIVLSWNNAPDTLACLESLSEIDYPNYTVLVVDNGSTDDSVVQIRTHFSEIEVLEVGSNLGYAEGNNVGLRHGLKGESDYLCVLNNDTILAPGCLEALVEEAESSPDIGMVGPKMYFYEPSDMVFAAGSIIDWRRGRLVHRGIWQKESETGPLHSDAAEDVDFIVGCCILVRRDLLESIGLLDRRYYLNFEDVDWCVRARQARYRVRYTPKALLWHKVSASLGQASPRNTYYMTRNRLLFFWTNLNGWSRWRAIAHIVARNIGHTAAWTLKHEYRVSTRAKRDTNVLAFRDALLGRFGKMGEDVEEACQRT